MHRFACALVILLACGKHGTLGADQFALTAKISGTTIELSGNYTGYAIDETRCAYRVDGSDIRFDIQWTGHDDESCLGSAGHTSPVMLTVQCHGPRLARGHYLVSEGIADAHGLSLLEGDVDASGNGDLSRRLQ